MAQIDISEINLVAKADPRRLVKAAEEKYKNFTLEVATRVARNDKVRIVLLAGPSGSGKTTTANLLADNIRKLGLQSFVLSLDNFYRNATDPSYPRLESGERDYESVDALDIDELEETLINIAEGREFSVPRYDFKKGARDSISHYPKISHGCVIIEGLHALNPRICEHLPKEKIFRIFISVSTNITYNGEQIISGRKIRFLRRTIRDSIYRGASAERTLKMWESVLLGEDKYLYPYREYADLQFDTFHAFELGVMMPYAKRLISPGLAERSDYAKTVLSAISLAEPVEEDLVPQDSLIREFITGGIYEEFY